MKSIVDFFLGEDKVPETKTPPIVEAERNRRAEDKYAHLEKLAEDREAELLARKDADFKLAMQLHAEDVASYKFECDRWSTFLNVKIARDTNKRYKNDLYAEATYCGAFNLDLVTRIEMTEGHLPDLEHTISYWTYEKYDKSLEFNDTRLRMERGRWLISTIPKRTGDAFIGSNDCHAIQYEIKRKTPNMPRPAKDDRIDFVGIDMSLYMPARTGAEIYKRILLATGKDAATQ